MESIRLYYKIWMEDSTGKGILGDGKWKMLKLIEEKGSMKAACDELGYTYRRTWGNLKKIEDFDGNYVAASAGAAAAGGVQVSTMKNQNDVKMKLKATQTGAKLTLAGEGIRVKIKK